MDKMQTAITKIPSDVRLSIIDMVGFCMVCDVFEGHGIVPCVLCEKDLCLSHTEGIYSLGHPSTKNFICVTCRHHTAVNATTKVVFYYTPRVKTIA